MNSCIKTLLEFFTTLHISRQGRSQAADSGQRSQAADSGQRPQAPDSGQRSEAPDPGQTSQAPDSGQTSAAADSGQRSQAPDSGQTSQVTDFAELAEWHLDIAAACMEQAQQMISGNGSPPVKFNHNQRRHSAEELILEGNVSTRVKLFDGQCKYLVEKLGTAIDYSRDAYLSASSSEHNSRYHEIRKLLYRLATEVQGFVHGCCKDEGMQVALTAASVRVYVCSLGYDLELCAELSHRSYEFGVASLTHTQLESLRDAEMLEVERRALCDEAALLGTINSLILAGKSISSFGQSQLATIVKKRWEASQAIPTLGLSQSSHFEAWKVDRKCLLRSKELGRGATSVVYKAKWCGAVEVAEKVFRVPSDAAFETEVSLLVKLPHPNIVSILGYLTDEQSCSIVTEVMDGDLYHLMVKKLEPGKVGMGPFSISVACDTMLQVAEGVHYMHQNEVVHRDLKSQNVLVRSKYDDVEYVCAKVADFGLSKIKERSFLCTHQTSNTGSSRSMAPELIKLLGEKKKAQNSFHPYKSDTYSFGMLCFEILTGELPFSSTKKDREVKKKVLRGDRPVLPHQCPVELKSLIESCWDPEPTKRPDFQEICEKLRCLKCSLLIGCPDLPEQQWQTVVSRQRLQATDSAVPPKWYLDSARRCMEHVQLMTWGQKSVPTKVKLYHNQCQYLADTLKMAIIEVNCQVSDPRYLQTQTQTSSELKAEDAHQLEMLLMLLWRSATEIERFIQDCCDNKWVKIALTSASVASAPSVSVSSLGSHLKLCMLVLLRNWNSVVLTQTELESLKEAELHTVKESASLDEVALINALSLILSGQVKRTDEFLLARILRLRLEARKAMSTALSPLSDDYFKIDSRSLRLGQMLGRGTRSTVHKCTWFGAEVAAKTFAGHNNPDFKSEISVLRGLCHPNIVHMLGYSDNEEKVIILMELMDRDLLSLMQERLEIFGGEAPFSIHEAVDLMLQIADGVKYLHEHKIVHRDLKSQNILLRCVKVAGMKKNIPEFLYAKVAGFALSKTEERRRTSNQTMDVGTARWMAPELIKIDFNEDRMSDSRIRYPFKMDIYSFGIVCFEILTGKIPYANFPLRVMKTMIIEGERPMLPDDCPYILKTLIEACWHQNPDYRPSSAEICRELSYIRYMLLLPGAVESRALQSHQQAQPVPEAQPIGHVPDFSGLSVPKIEYSCLRRGVQIGKGGQESCVYETIYHRSEVAKDRVAQKRFFTAYNEEFKREVTILADLKHSNIVSLVGYAMDMRSCSTVMEMMDGDLHYLMGKYRSTPSGPFPIDEAVRAMLQIAQGMDYVHQNNVVHRDLKSHNILGRRAHNGRQLDFKVADFGLSEKIKPGSNLRFNIGTPHWMGPEVMRLERDVHRGTSTRRTRVSSKFLYFSNAMGKIPLMSEEEVKKYPDPFMSDIYSFGIVCFEVLTGNAPTLHLKNRSGNVFKEDPLKAAILLLFLFVEGKIKLEDPQKTAVVILLLLEELDFKEDPQKTAVAILLLLEGLNFKEDPKKATVVLLLLHLKFKEKNPNEAVKEKVLAGYRPLLPDYCPPKLKTLIGSCWDKDASTRPSFAQIIVDLKGLL